MPTQNGTDLRVFKDGVLLGGENECSVSFSHEPRDASTKDTGRWNNSEEGSLGAEISGSGFVPADAEDVMDVLYDALVSQNPVSVVFGVNSGGSVDTTKHRYIGQFRLTSFEQSGSHRQTATYSYTLQSVGIVTSWNPNS